MVQLKSEQKFGHGSVVSLRLRDFMQFTEVVFRPGPTLNVVLGPNGAGKSSLVNAIALALGAKTAVLGRADNFHDFIRTDCQEAELEIELFNAQARDSNYIIRRVITMPPPGSEDKRKDKKVTAKEDGETGKKAKSKWWLNGQSVIEKRIHELVKSLNIQTDNLVQFLPQDKVHDFSKMNSKELLVRTVDAVGDVELRADHDKLKNLQRSLVDTEDKRTKKEDTLNSLKREAEGMENLVKNFEIQTRIKEKLKLLKQKNEWSLVDEAKEAVSEQQKVRNDIYKRLQEQSIEVEPLKDKFRAITREKEKIESEVKALRSSISQNRNMAFQVTLDLERKPDNCLNLKADFEALLKAEQEKQKHVETLEEQLEELKAELKKAEETSGEKTEMLERKCASLDHRQTELHKEKNELEGKLRQFKYEQKNHESKLQHLHDEHQRLMDVRMQKMEVMRSSLNLGRDTAEAMKWLDQHRDQFQGQVYDPILMCIDVHDGKENAKYLENTISAKELVAFAAENADDMNKLMKQFRDVMKLRVNVVQVTPNSDAERMRSRSGDKMTEADKKRLGFKGFVKDMFSCPGPIKAYLCKLYQLHNIPVFSPQADEHLQELVTEYRVFFTGAVRHSVTVSSYSMATSTSSSSISNRNWLQISVDKVKIKEVQKNINVLESKMEGFREKFAQEEKLFKETSDNLEATRKELKAAHAALGLKKALKGRVQAKEMQVHEARKNMKSVDMNKEREKMRKAMAKLCIESAKLAKQVKDIVLEMTKSRTRMDMLQISSSPLHKQSDKLKAEIEEIKQDLIRLKTSLGEEEESLRHCQESFSRQLKNAQRLCDEPDYGGANPPKSLRKAWNEIGIDKISAQEAQIQIMECEGDLENIDDVSPADVQKYRDIIADIDRLESELFQWESVVKQNREDINTIRERWLVKLEELVSRVSAQFSIFFEHMGFAGCVELNKGQHEDDFTNYGFDVMVKFRDKLPLQRLDPFKQSGGERSVSTALYMMALQSMTKVPFRCVDEINQGMDERNERKVFDLLIETSVRANSAQYFMLTPKLLPDLHYEKGVTVLIVHNGEDMCKHDKWDMNRFKAIAKARRKK